MKKIIVGLLAALLLFAPDCFAQKTKIACIGNSITFGHGINDREHFHYPAQLQRYLGSDYEVKNFGVSATTMLLKGDFPYVTTEQYKESLAFLPDIVIIKFGTNDTKSKNWKYREDFIKDYQAFIDSYRNLSSHPKIILLTPIRCFLPLTDWDIRGDYVEQYVRPMIEELAYTNKIDIVNMFNVLGDHWDHDLLPDKLHPSALGAGDMALKLYQHIKTDGKDIAGQTPDLPFLTDAKPFNFHGYQGYEFTNQGVACKIVAPKVEAEGKPWIWRARFWGHEPQTEIDLLERGFYVAYCDVADLYGNDKAVKRWDDFYKMMVKAGFSKKVALEGMSRGSLIVYNWAAKNAKKVACIYADAPVMTLQSWPLGQASNEGYRKDIDKMLQAYGFSSEAEARQWKQNPMDHAAVMAKAGIPILHVVGDVDETVPYRDNTEIFEAKMKRLGAPIQVIHKPAIAHHPHSLNNPKPIVDFILKAMKQ